jgi:hypothetical protein
LIDTPEDKEFTDQKNKNAVASMGHKALGENGITSEIFNSVVDFLLVYITAMYNG